ncbi:MAG: cytochrome-c peroxidase [Spirosomataceae bacterium]
MKRPTLLKGMGLVTSLIIWATSCSLLGLDVAPISLFKKPDTFPEPTYNFSKNPLTPETVELGRSLFYDGLLSRDGTISCGECHNQSHAFTHHGHVFSHGIDDRIGNRNAQALMNLAWQSSFFWDGGVFDLDMFSIAPIENHNEMDESLSNVLKKVQATPRYQVLFKKAYGTEDVTSERFLKALSQFMLTLVSANSKYDQMLAGKATFTADEQAGLRLFTKKGCASCHPAPLFTDGTFRSNGLLPEYTGDLGRFRITENPSDKNKFKVPSLRNVEMTAPYMHDGRYLNLSMAVSHYSDLVEDTGTLDEVLKSKDQLGIPMTSAEKQQITAFLKTLTDTEFLQNPRFSEFYKP